MVRHMGSDRHRILLLIDQLTIGGQEEHFFVLSNEIDRSRFEPVLGYVNDGPYRERAVEADIQLVKYTDDFPFGWGNILEPANSLRRVIRSEDIDLVHSSTTSSNLWAAIATKFTGVPHVRTQGNLLKEREPRFAWLLDNVPFSGRLADKHVYLIEGQRKELLEYGIDSNRLTFVPPGVDVRTLNPENDGSDVRDEFGIPHTCPVVGMLQRVEKGRGFEMLIEAAVSVLEDHHDTWFLLVGDGPYLDTLKDFVNEKGMNDRFVFPGFRTDSADVIAALDIATYTPENATGGQFVREAMASGKPVVTTDDRHVNQRSFINDGENGLLIEPGDTAALADAITWLLDDPDRIEEIGTNARLTTLERFDTENMIAAYETLYTELLGD